MIDIKNSNEIESMKKGGKILADVLFEVLNHIKPGVSEIELDSLAEQLIIAKGGEPGFKKVEGYHNTICISVNDVVVHGVPTEYKLKEGDVVGIDCGVYYEGFHTDMSETVRVRGSKINFPHQNKVDNFLQTGKKALDAGIVVSKVGNRVGDISKAIQNIVEGEGYSVVRSLVGHGVGRELHEEPEVPGFLQGEIAKTQLLLEGMTLAVEVIYNMGKPDVVYGNDDGWTIKTKDGEISGVFERTLAITKNGPLILTK